MSYDIFGKLDRSGYGIQHESLTMPRMPSATPPQPEQPSSPFNSLGIVSHANKGSHVNYTLHWFTGLAAINSNVMKPKLSHKRCSFCYSKVYIQSSKGHSYPTVPNLSTKSQIECSSHPSISTHSLSN